MIELPVEDRRPRLSTVAAPVELSIVVVTWNSERWIERCLAAIPAACEGLAHEIVIYDNGSGDATVARLNDDVHLIRSETNDGFAAAVNRAVAESRGRYVFMLNPDCELAPDALTRLHEFLEREPKAAAAVPLLEGDGQREFQLRRLPTFRGLLSEIFAFNKLLPRNRATAHYRYHDLDLTTPQRVEQPAAAALLIRRETLDEVGPLDERFSPAWFEDVDYCRRLAEAEKAVYVVPAAIAKHYGGASLEHLSFERFNELWYRNMWLYARKWFPAGEAEALRWAIIAGTALRSIAALIGIAHPEVGRLRGFRAYVKVMGKAFHRWNDSSRSS